MKKDGFRAFGDKVSLASGERKLLTVLLEPTPPPSPSAGKTTSRHGHVTRPDGRTF